MLPSFISAFPGYVYRVEVPVAPGKKITEESGDENCNLGAFATHFLDTPPSIARARPTTDRRDPPVEAQSSDAWLRRAVVLPPVAPALPPTKASIDSAGIDSGETARDSLSPAFEYQDSKQQTDYRITSPTPMLWSILPPLPAPTTCSVYRAGRRLSILKRRREICLQEPNQRRRASARRRTGSRTRGLHP